MNNIVLLKDSKGLSVEFTKRLVYITLGLTGSGKSSRIKSMLSAVKDRSDISCLVISREDYMLKGDPYVFDRIDNATKQCISALENALKDPSIRRIFIDDCNLLPELRDKYIGLCEKYEIEWINLCVGRFNNHVAKYCVAHNTRGFTQNDLDKQLRYWGVIYSTQLAILERVKAKYKPHRARLMRDIEVVSQGGGLNRNVITLGLKEDGSFRRRFTFKSLIEADKAFLEADSVRFNSGRDKSVLEVSKAFKGSYSRFN